MNDDILVALDVGSVMTRAMAVKRSTGSKGEVFAVAIVPTEGVRHGVVINIEAAMHSVTTVLSELEETMGREIEEVVVGIGDSHVEGLNSRGVVAITGKQGEISSGDVARVIEAARAVAIPMDRELLHVIPRNYAVDGQKHIKDPTHMMGVRLEVEIHMVTAATTSGQSLVRAINRSGFRVRNIVFSGLAASKVVLSRDEEEMGVLLINIGGETTDVLVIYEGAPLASFVIPLGGKQITNDLSAVLHTSVRAAEELKKEHGIAYHALVDSSDPILVPGVGSRPPRMAKPEEICEIIQARMTEIFQEVARGLQGIRFQTIIQSGIVLTGGGALLAGITELAEKTLRMHVRAGIPRSYGGRFEKHRKSDMSVLHGIAVMGNEMLPTNDEGKKNGLFKEIKRWIRNFVE